MVKISVVVSIMLNKCMKLLIHDNRKVWKARNKDYIQGILVGVNYSDLYIKVNGQIS